jgi:hypothetical protein
VNCTAWGSCSSCAKINKVTSSGGASCVKTTATNWDLDCNVNYDVDCDC